MKNIKLFNNFLLKMLNFSFVLLILRGGVDNLTWAEYSIHTPHLKMFYLKIEPTHFNTIQDSSKLCNIVRNLDRNNTTFIF